MPPYPSFPSLQPRIQSFSAALKDSRICSCFSRVRPRIPLSSALRDSLPFTQFVSCLFPALGSEKNSEHHADKSTDKRALESITAFIHGHYFTSLAHIVVSVLNSKPKLVIAILLRLDVHSSRALLARHDVEQDGLTFLKRLESEYRCDERARHRPRPSR
jgi:hypothetical protein